MSHYTVEENAISDDMTVYDVVRWEGPNGHPVATRGRRGAAVLDAAALNIKESMGVINRAPGIINWGDIPEAEREAILSRIKTDATFRRRSKRYASWLLIAVPVALFMVSVVYHWLK